MASPSPGNSAIPSSAPTTSQDDDDEFSLDFTVPSKLAPPGGAAVSERKVAEALAFEPPLTLAPQAPAAPPAPAVPAFPLVRLDPAVEEGARLFASGQLPAARKALETAVQGGNAVETVWGMLFDLYRLIGEHDIFEKLAMEFAQRFEKSPPAWVSQQAAKSATAAGGDGRASIALTGALNSRCAPQFAQLVRIAMTRSQLRLELAKIQDADNGGCALLLGALQYLKKTPCDLRLGSAEHLAGMLKPKLVSGQRENDAIWLLLLEIYQRLNQSEDFEALALDYAITFEVSPPSWEAPKPTSDSAVGGEELPALAAEEQAVALSLSGELLNAGAASFAALGQAFADGTQDEIVIDAGALKRIDQPSAEALTKALRAQPLAERRVRIKGASHLVAAMLDMAGVGQLVTVERLRF